VVDASLLQVATLGCKVSLGVKIDIAAKYGDIIYKNITPKNNNT